MHSLSLRIFTGFNNSAAADKRGVNGAADSEFGSRRRVGFGLRDLSGKDCRIVVACASGRNSNGGGRSQSSSSTPSQNPSSFLTRSQTYALLKQQMEVAAKSEVVGYFFIYFLNVIFYFFFGMYLRIYLSFNYQVFFQGKSCSSFCFCF